MEIILVILLAVTAALAAWNIRLASQARGERGGLRQSLENLEVRMGEISGILTGSNQSIAEAKATQSEREKSDIQHRKDVLAAQEKAAVSGREIQEIMGRLTETLSALQSSQRESLQSSALDTAKTLQSVSAGLSQKVENVAAELSKKLEGLESQREASAQSGIAALEKMKQYLGAEIQSVQSAWTQTVESLRFGITENREGLAETVAQSREAAAKGLEETLEAHSVRIRELLEGVRTGAVDARAQTLTEVEGLLSRFEKRVADYLEENALKVQEVLLESLDRFPEEATATQILARSEEGREPHGR